MSTTGLPPAKPVPAISADSAPYWEGCSRGELLYQRCEACHRTQSYPRSFCWRCGSGSLRWNVAAGEGTVHSFTIVHRAPTDAFKADLPYVIVLVEFAEGFRLMMNLVEGPSANPRIGMPVRIVFEDRGGVRLPQASVRP